MAVRLVMFELPTSGSPAYEAFIQNKAHEISRLNHWLKLYEPYAPCDFLKHIINAKSLFHIQTRLWELVLGCYLITKGMNLLPYPKNKKNMSNRPDLGIKHEGRTIWIECVMPMGVANLRDGRVSSNDPRAYFRDDESGLKLVDDEPVGDDSELLSFAESRKPEQLSFTNVVQQKSKQYHAWLEKGIIGPADSYVIAINAHNWHGGMTVNPIAPFYSVLWGLGSPAIQYKTVNGFLVRSAYIYSHEPTVKKNNGSEVGIDIFRQPENNFISGVLFKPDLSPFSLELTSDAFIHYAPNHPISHCCKDIFRNIAQIWERPDEEGFAVIPV